VPCLSYDTYGYRIGYGKGYYDRFLSSFDGTKIGLCYSAFKSDRLPRGKYDIKLDIVITEKGVTVIK
jgi:5-formyltetrahydrofolate cyclo-ligase